jgi:hypothetical protein
MANRLRDSVPALRMYGPSGGSDDEMIRRAGGIAAEEKTARKKIPVDS